MTTTTASTSPGDVRVLHVDDDSAFCDLAKEFLQRHDLTVLTETSASDGLERLAEASVECVVSDYDMPGMDGLDFLEAVRERDPDLPFILFTGRGSEEVASDAVSSGVSDYLQKQGTAEQYELLANRIHNYAEQYRARAAAEMARRRYELASAVASDVIFEHDVAADETVYADGFASVFGYDPEAAGSQSWWLDRIHPEDRDRVASRLAEAVGDGRTTLTLEYRFRDAEGEYRHLSEDRYVEYDGDDPERIVGAFRDVTEERRRERRLDALNDTAQSLIGATSTDDAARTVSDAGAVVLGLPINAVYLREGDHLHPQAWTDAAFDVIGDLPVLPLEDSIMGRVYRRDEAEHFDDVRTSEDRYNPETPIRSELYASIEGHGVFVAASTTVADFSETDIDLVRVLADHLGAALDRIQG